MGRVATAVDIIDHLLNLLMYNVHRKFTRLSVSIVLAKNFTGETGTKSVDNWPFCEGVVDNIGNPTGHPEWETGRLFTYYISRERGVSANADHCWGGG